MELRFKKQMQSTLVKHIAIPVSETPCYLAPMIEVPAYSLVRKWHINLAEGRAWQKVLGFDRGLVLGLGPNRVPLDSWVRGPSFSAEGSLQWSLLLGLGKKERCWEAPQT